MSADADRLVRHTRPHHKTTCVTIDVPQDCIHLTRLGRDNRELFIRVEPDGSVTLACNHMGKHGQPDGDGSATLTFNEFHAAIAEVIRVKYATAAKEKEKLR